MKIETVNRSKIIVRLTDSEVMLFFGGYSEISLSNESFKSVINKIIIKAVKNNPDFASNRDYIIEIRSKALSGCEIHITKSGKTAELSNNIINRYIFYFNNSENMIKAVNRLYLSYKTRNLNSSVYKFKDCFVLIIKSERFKNIEPLISEYSSGNLEYSSVAESFFEEYGILIAKEKAIKVIGKSFSKAL